ncbi:MAG: amidohydrolase family protein [Gaiellaceae bacterium]
MISYLENHILRPGARRSCRLGAATAALLAATLLAATGSSSGSIKTDPALATALATPLALVNGTLIDGTGARPVENAVVLIKGKRIVFAGPRRKVAIPARARRIDVHGGTILPGFINTHVHNAFNDETLRRWLLGGVTTVRDLGSGPDYKWAFSFRGEVNRSSRIARLLAVGPLITVPGGYPEAIWGNPGLEVTSVADARAKVERLIKAGCDTVKIALESGEIFGRSGLPELSVDEVRAIVEVAHRHHLRVSAHAMVTADLERAVEGGVDEIAHIDTQNTPQSLIKRMVADRIDWVPTLELIHLVGVSVDGDNLKRFVRAGGVVALGTDYDGAPNASFDLGMPIHELIYMDQLGMTPMQAIKAATSNAAYAVGHPELGVLKKGKIADVIAVEGNPLKDLKVLTKTRLVVHNGTVVLNKLG